jgi:hypothetical protein
MNIDERNRGKRGEGRQRNEEGGKVQERFNSVCLLLLMLCVRIERAKRARGVRECVCSCAVCNASALVLCVPSNYLQLQPYLHLNIHSHISTHPTEI